MILSSVNRIWLASLLGLMTTMTASAQVISVKYDLVSMQEKNQLEVFNRAVTPFSDNDKKGISFSKKENEGIAWLQHVIFSNGTIEADIRGKDVFQQSFVGIAFHGTDNKTMDIIYFRPFNFHVEDSVRKSHAVQYVSLPEYPWEVLRDKFKGVYEKPLKSSPDGIAWFHVKIIVKSPLITVYVNGSKEPSLSVEKLNNRASGRIGLWVGNNSDGDFANLEISSLTDLPK